MEGNQEAEVTMSLNNYQIWKNHYICNPIEADNWGLRVMHVQNLMQDYPGPENVFRYAGTFNRICEEFDLQIIELVRFFNLAINENRTLTPEWILTTGYDMLGRK